MTTFVPFTPSASASPPFATTITLDGNAYGLTVIWNLYRQDWYLSLADTEGNPVVTMPLIASPADGNINLVGGYFMTSTLVYREATGNFEVNP